MTQTLGRTISTSTLRVHGAARSVTGSCHQLDVAGATLLVDCGLFQGEHDATDRNRQCPVAHPADVAAVVLTHGHLDHVGRVPLLVRGGFAGPILGHPATLEIAAIVLRDALKVARYEGCPTHDEDDVERAIARFRPLPYQVPRTIAPGVRLTLFDAGHILGSASVLVESPEVNVLFSGDLGRAGTPILRDPNTRYPAGTRVDCVVLEATYGDREHRGAAPARERLRSVLRRALGDGGKVLVPAFSIGRTQELLYHLRALVAAGELSDVPVIVDGPMGLDVTALYERYRDEYDAEALALLRNGKPPLSFDTLYSARTGRASELARTIDGPALVIAGSGMCTGGRVLGHLEDLLPDARTDVLLVGYQARGTLGRELLDGADRVIVRGRPVRVRAQVTSVPGLSAHADQSGLLAWLAAVPGPVRRVFVVHGEPAACEALAAATRERLGIEAVVPAHGERHCLDDGPAAARDAS
jgi:metallo-beta-lactamase family protein